MTYATKLLTLLDMIFIILLMASGTVGGALGTAVYYLAFFIPTALGLYCSYRFKTRREEERGLAEPLDRYLGINAEQARLLLPAVFPTVLVIMIISLLTSLLFGLFGLENAAVEDAPILEMIIVHALAPAVLEELLFRYIPMKLLLPYSPRVCVTVSSLYFALIHCNIFQYPYALVAGVLFMTLNVAVGSVWPSVILHFVNNLLSVVMMKYFDTPALSWAFIGALLLASAISLVFILRRREAYRDGVKAAFARGEPFSSTNAPLALIVISVYIAFVRLFQ